MTVLNSVTTGNGNFGTSKSGFSSLPLTTFAGAGAFATGLPVSLAYSSRILSSSFNLASCAAIAIASNFAYLSWVSFNKIASTSPFFASGHNLNYMQTSASNPKKNSFIIVG